MNPFGNMGCLNAAPAPFTSRLNFRCCHCGASGSRTASYHAQPGCVPGFFDKCPTCHSIDVEVVDPAIYGGMEEPS
jgi:hypothetical protein